jgi:uncharacterized protein (TIGR00369 family)
MDGPEAARGHVGCAVCGDRRVNDASLGLRFVPDSSGGVTGSFRPGRPQQGYDGLAHGGLLCTLLDAAMTHCLFAQGVRALTAELTVRFVTPARLGEDLAITGRLVTQRRRTSRLEATIVQAGRLVARASAVFIAPREGIGPQHCAGEMPVLPPATTPQ